MSEHAEAPAAGRAEFAAAIRAPLLIAGLGALFLVQDYGGPAFWRTWPTLLVLWGALLALGRWGRPA